MASRVLLLREDAFSECCLVSFNPLDSKGNYSGASNDTKLVHWPLTGGLLHLVQRGGACAYPSTASIPITLLLGLHNGRLLCGFNVAIKGLILPVRHQRGGSAGRRS